jgi:glycosyltransferase involved in cell wall biosynthesis
VLTIGHSYAVALNRAALRELSKAPDFAITVLAPKCLHGDLRPLRLDAEPKDSNLKLIGIDANFTGYLNLLGYDDDQLKAAIDSEPYDILHLWIEPFTHSAHQVIEALGKRSAKVSFWTFENIARDYPPPFGDFEREVVARADCWMAGGQLVYETQVQRGYARENGHVVCPAVDRSLFAPATATQKADVLRELDLRAPVLGFLGRLTEEKGIGVMTAALDRIDRSVEWSLLVMGSGPMEADILRWVADRGLSTRVRIRLLEHGAVPRVLRALDVLVVPSQTRTQWKEQFGRVIIEAFASGVPVIASDSGEIPFVVGDAGRIVPEGDVAAWAEAIHMLLLDPRARRMYVERGLERCEQFSSEATASRLGSIFRMMAAKGAP